MRTTILPTSWSHKATPHRRLAAVVNALSIRDSAEARSLFVQCVRGRRLTFDPGSVRPLMLRALTEPWDRPADLAIPAVSLVKLNPVIKENCERAAGAWPVRIMAEGLAGRPTGDGGGPTAAGGARNRAGVRCRA